MPNWQTIAKAVYAANNRLIKLSTSERNEARLLQDDRKPPEVRLADWNHCNPDT